MRTIFMLVGLVAFVLALLMLFGLISVGGARLPTVEVQGGQAPNIDVGTVDVGSENKTIQVPTLDVQRADNTTAPR
jgi:hypothetical protein